MSETLSQDSGESRKEPLGYPCKNEIAVYEWELNRAIELTRTYHFNTGYIASLQEAASYISSDWIAAENSIASIPSKAYDLNWESPEYYSTKQLALNETQGAPVGQDSQFMFPDMTERYFGYDGDKIASMVNFITPPAMRNSLTQISVEKINETSVASLIIEEGIDPSDADAVKAYVDSIRGLFTPNQDKTAKISISSSVDPETSEFLEIITHEIGHHAHSKLSIAALNRWQHIVDQDPSARVTEYVDRSYNTSRIKGLREDFADSFTSFRTSPEHLHDISPIRFLGMYEIHCDNYPSFHSRGWLQVGAQANRLAKRRVFSPKAQTSILEACAIARPTYEQFRP